MFSTEETVDVTLLCEAELMKAVIDHGSRRRELLRWRVEEPESLYRVL